MNVLNRDRKTLRQLTFKDNFMFAAVMMDEDIAKDSFVFLILLV